MKVTFAVNDAEATLDVASRTSLAEALRDHLGLTGTHAGYEHVVGGASTRSRKRSASVTRSSEASALRA